jgi:2-phospho-L-lactate guanylyltransferase (CobY/MobA/RfbA family)
MNFSERCEHTALLLGQLKDVVDALDKDAGELEVTIDDEPLLARMVQGFLACNRLSVELLYEQIPHIDQEVFAVGTGLRLAHDELMRRARGAHTDMEVYTKLRSSRRAGTIHRIRHAS